MQSLWRKERGSSSYVDIFKDFISIGADPSNSEEKKETSRESKNKHQKCDKTAVERRKEGNVLFSKEQWSSAMSCYSESLRFASTGSENIAFAYANRSSCFLKMKMYDKCLVDIELAKFSGYPEHLMPKLEKRRIECLDLLKTDDRFHENAPQLSYDADEKFHGMANVLEMKYNSQFGRHIVAKSDIEVGKTVLLEEAFVTQLLFCTHSNSSMCETCTKPWMNFIPCKQCSNVQFCSTDCMEKNEFHKMECQGETSEFYDFESCLECTCESNQLKQNTTRAVLFGIKLYPDIEQLKSFVEDAIRDRHSKVPQAMNDAQSKYRGFLQLFVKPRLSKKVVLDHSYIIYKELLSRDSIKTKFDTQDKRNFLKHLVVHCQCTVHSNSFNCVQQKSLFIIFSYINHSCASNLVYANHGNQMMCITVRPVKAGDQLYVNYFQPLAKNDPTVFELQQLGKIISLNFSFKCQCEKCKSTKWLRSGGRFKSDPQFIALEKELDKFLANCLQHTDPTLKRKTSLTLQSKCIELLNKYGDEQWNKGIDTLAHGLSSLLKIS